MKNKRARIKSILAISAGVTAGAVFMPGVESPSHGGADAFFALLSAGSNEAFAADRSGKQPRQPLADLNQSFIRVAASAAPSVVTIYTESSLDRPAVFPADFFGPQPDERNRSGNSSRPVMYGLGSGVIVRADGYILTNSHVVEGVDSVSIMTSDKRKIPARVVGTDPRTDIAVLKADASGLKPVTMGDSNRLQVGEWVLAIGSPIRANLSNTVSRGIVSSKGGPGTAASGNEEMIQTDASINPGNSGGALVNISGELVGISTASANRVAGFESIGFAVPSNTANRVLRQILERGSVSRGYIGVDLVDIDANLARGLHMKTREGVMVETVVENGPAARGGLMSGDVIFDFNGRKTSSAEELRNLIASQSPGSTATVLMSRDGVPRNLTLRVEGSPSRQGVVAEPASGLDSNTLGFKVSKLTAQIAEQMNKKADSRRVIVTAVRNMSPASTADLQPGDIILSVDKKPLTSITAFEDAVKGKKRGDKVLLLIERGWSRKYCTFIL